MKLILPAFMAILLALLNFSALAEETPPPLINSGGEHVLAKGLRLIIKEQGKEPIRWTISRSYPDETSADTTRSPLATSGQPYVFCWEMSTRRLWVASQEVIGYVNFVRLPAEIPKDISDHGNLSYGGSPVSAELVAEMPANFREAAAKWIRVAKQAP